MIKRLASIKTFWVRLGYGAPSISPLPEVGDHFGDHLAQVMCLGCA